MEPASTLQPTSRRAVAALVPLAAGALLSGAAAPPARAPAAGGSEGGPGRNVFERAVRVASEDDVPRADDFSAYLPLEGVRGPVREGRVVADDEGNRLLTWIVDSPTYLYARVLDRDRKIRGSTIVVTDPHGTLQPIVLPGLGWIVPTRTSAGLQLHRVDVDGRMPWREGVRVVAARTHGPATFIQSSATSVLALWLEWGRGGGKNRYRAQRFDAAGRAAWREPILVGEAVQTYAASPPEPVLQPGPRGTVRAHLVSGVLSDTGSVVTRHAVLIHPDGRVEPVD